MTIDPADHHDSMLKSLLSVEVRVATTCHPSSLRTPYPEEAEQLKYASEQRMTEFATGRLCARRALHKIGVGPHAILIGANREPIWPDQVTGSITHCPGFYAAAVCMRSAVASLGIDAEPHQKLPVGTIEHVLFGRERRWVEGAPKGVFWDRLIFSAKESLYKAWFQLTAEWLGFENASILIDNKTRTFSVEILLPSSYRIGVVSGKFKGRFQVSNGLILTTVEYIV